MANPPAVRQLQDLIGTIGQSVQPQQQLLDQQIIQNDQSGAAQVAGLDATKNKAFGQIEQGAQNKGMFFSGFTPDEQADYTATSYLPALANLQSTIASVRGNLIGQKNALNTDVFNKAFDTQNQDQAVLNDWNKMTAQQQFEASEADKQRVFTAQQNQKDRSASAANAAASRSNEPTPTQNMAAAFSAQTGSDGFVSPGTYQSLKNQWVSGGYGNAQSFDTSFATFRNPKNTAYKIG